LKYKKSYKLLKNEISEILKSNKINMKGGGDINNDWFFNSLRRKEDIKDKKHKIIVKKKKNF
jgi:hypothetical protein